MLDRHVVALDKKDPTRITAKAAADLLGISVDTLYRYAADGTIPAKKLGSRRWIFVREQILEWLASS